jgi:hypothetical protein
MTALALQKPQIELPDEHADYYLVDGRRVRRWHTVAREMGLEPQFPQPGEPGYWNTVNAKHRSKQVHAASAMLIRGVPFDLNDLDDESLPYVQAFLTYWTRHGEIAVETETPLYCAALDFCTTPDHHTVRRVNDVKGTDRPWRAWGLQSAAQALALNGGRAGRRIIWLRPKLKTRSYEILEPGDTRAFSDLDFDVVREACAGIEGPAIQAWKRGE